MRTKLWRIVSLLTLLAMLITAAGVPNTAHAAPVKSQFNDQKSDIQVIEATSYGVSKPLGELALKNQSVPESVLSSYQAQNPQRLVLPKAQNGLSNGGMDTSIMQNAPIGKDMPTATANFDGVSNLAGVLPPDTQGDIGYDPATGKKYYVQWVNLYFQIWDVTNPAAPVAKLASPVAGNTLFSSLGGICASNNDGDPITLYDHLANRWMMSQFALQFPSNFHQCIAVSATADPTGSWYLYDFQTSTVNMNDYPHFGVWPDGYYMSVNQFNGSTEAWAGAGVAVFERSQMLQGLSARMVYINVGGTNSDYGGMLPSDLDGPAPATGTPNYFMEWDDSSWITGDTTDNLRIWQFHVDWTNTANTTFGTNTSYTPNYKIATTNVSVLCSGVSNCIPQSGTTVKLDGLADRLMYRLQYRNFGSYATLVANHTVDTGSTHAGIHWFELRNSGSGWAINQESVYNPDTNHRWLGSIAMDDAGDMALAYSVSSSSMFPSIRYTGRLSSDTASTMPQGEATLVTGGGYQSSTSYRWGDYSMLGLDPQDGCTFWYTSEYYSASSTSSWKTRIGSFKFPSCTTQPTGNLSGTVTNGSSPLADASIDANGYVTSTDASGHYSIDLPASTYTITVSKYGYATSSVSGVSVPSGGTATQNFTLGPATFHTVSGVVTNAVKGWPLYASISINGYPNGPVFTDPVTGAYNVSLADGGPYTFSVNALGGGYSTGSASLTISANATQNFSLTADTEACTAIGYNYIPGTVFFSENFDSVAAPAFPTGWSKTDTSGTAGDWTSSTTSTYPTGITPRSAPNLAIFNSYTASSGASTRLFRTTGVNLSAQTTAEVSFWMYHESEYTSNDRVQLQISTNGSTWTNVGTAVSRYDGSLGWKKHTININSYTGTGMTTVYIALNGISAYGNDIHIDDLTIGTPSQCNAYAGLVVGAVMDANTSAAINNATVTDGSHTATWVDNSLDPAQPHPMYITGEAAGSVSLTASAFQYSNTIQTPTVVSGGVVRQNFSLAAGKLSASPSSLTFNVTTSSPTSSQPVNLVNTGGASATYEVFAVIGAYAGYTATGPFADNTRHTGPPHLNDVTAASLRIPPEVPSMPLLAAGNVTASWDTGLAAAWGIGYNTETNDLWLSNILVGGGDNQAYAFTTAGVSTGDAISGPWINDFAADMTYNPFTNKLWQVNVSGDNCIYELDPVARVSTGNKICPAFGTPERGLAFDPATNTYYAGSWNDYIINHFAPDGTILDSKVVSLSISGLAYNPSTRHLFVLSNTDSTITPTHYDITVLDTANDYAIVGGFNLLLNGVEAFAKNGQSGLEIDCDGNLWASSYTAQKVFVADSGETGICSLQSTNWLSAAPTTGTVSAAGSSPITVSVDATSMTAGTYDAYLRVVGNTPLSYGDTIIPVTLNVTAGKPVLTVTASSASITYGDAAPTITPSYLGFTNGDTAAVLDTAPTCTVSAALTVANSPVTTTCSGGVDDKYNFAYVSGAVTVGSKTIDVTANNKTITFGQPEPTFDYIAVGFVAPDTFVTAPTCAVVENPHTAVGTYTIACSGGNAGTNYNISYHTGVFSILNGTKPTLTVTASSPTITYGTTPTVTPQYSGFVDGDTAAVLDTAPTCTAGTGPFTVSGSPYTTSCSGGVDDKYDFAYVNGSATVNAKTLDVTANNKTISFGNPEPTFDYTAVGFVAPDTFVTAPTCSVAGAHTAVGTYTITCSGGNAGSNYSIAYHSGTFTVSAKPVLTVTASSATITYGDAAPSITPQYSGFTGGDTAAVLDTAPTCSASAALTVANSPVTTTCSGGVDDKYDFNYLNGAVTVNAKALTITASNASKTYGQTKTFAGTEFTLSGLVSGDAVSSVTLTSTGAAATAVVNSYNIVPSAATGTGLSNYTIGYANGTLTVTQAPLTATADNKSKFSNAADPTFTVSYSGFVNSETASVLDTAPTCTSSGNHSVVGTYSITCSGGADNNYAFSYQAGTLIVHGPTFADVGYSNWAWKYIEALAGSGVTGGCGGGNYCPNANVTRAQMAVFLLRAKHGNAYVPPAASGTVFTDVAANSFAAAYIEALVAEGITGGCGGGNFCPNKNITRAEMAVFLLRGLHGNTYVPPTATGTVFTDVSASSFAAAYIEAMSAEGISGGCGNGNFCPNKYITRAEMAVFLVSAFSLPTP